MNRITKTTGAKLENPLFFFFFLRPNAGEGTAGCAGGLAAGLGADEVAGGVPIDGLPVPLDLAARSGVYRRCGGGEPETWLSGVARRWRLEPGQGGGKAAT